MRLLTILIALLASSSATAQTPIDAMRADLSQLSRNVKELQRDVAALEGEAVEQAAFRTSQAAAMAELLSRQVAQTAPTKESAKSWVDAASQARKELMDAANDPKFLTSAPPEVRELAQACVRAAAEAQVTNEDMPAFALTGCSTKQQQELKEKLRDLEAAARQAYEKCRRLVQERAPEFQDLVPRNAHDADGQLLQQLGSYPDADVRECRDSLNNAHQQLKEIKDSKAILSNALMMAANVCFASGGNPYVCGAMLAVAIFMEIFDGSGGGGNGDGDGKGEGPKEGGAGGGQSVPVVSAGPPSETLAGKAERIASAQQAVQQGPAMNLGKAVARASGDGNLGAAAANSNVSCNGANARIRCAIDGVPESDRHFFGPGAITKLASHPVEDAIAACLRKRADGSLEVAGIAIKDGAEFHTFGHNPQKGTQELGGTSRSFEEACRKVR